jgi:hypothetical protein
LRLRIILLTLAANSPPWSACQGFWHKNSVTCDVCVCVCACVSSHVECGVLSCSYSLNT